MISQYFTKDLKSENISNIILTIIDKILTEHTLEKLIQASVKLNPYDRSETLD